ncbi:MAG: hypothetical protein GVY13_07900 [Alphaproteobacteria bacterium]|jgi:hypothetical protein|nr:hypothetical protein [Alphaproteobacteria bacterium]
MVRQVSGHRFATRGSRLGLIAAFALGLIAGPAAAQDEPTSPEVLEARFQAAILDAQNAEPHEIVGALFAVTPYNPALVWRTYGERQQVLVLSWMSESKLQDTFPGTPVADMAAGLEGAAPEGRDIWVTLVPQVQDACRGWGLRGDALELRLKQYLGLNASWTYYGLTAMWVSAEDLYRPCPDPEIDDTSCTLSGAQEGAYGSPVDPAFAEWFERTRAGSYSANGAPWTRLGYTFDWAEGVSDVGASEYLIAPAAPVVLSAISDPDVYCLDP